MCIHDALQNHWDIDLINLMWRWCLTEYKLLYTLNFQLSINIVFNLFFNQLSQQNKECHIH